MKRMLLSLVMVVLAMPAFAARKEPLDPDCHKMASNAKGFAELRATGLATTPEQLAAFIVQPTVQSYPIKSIVDYVFSSEGKSPDEIYQSLYGRCKLMGYTNLYTYFQDREAAEILKAQLIHITERVSALEADNAKLVQENTELQKRLGMKRR